MKECLGKIGNRKIEDFIIEPKYDGFRIYSLVTSQGVPELYTRNHKLQAGKLPHVEEVLASVLPPDTLVDGEIMAPIPSDMGEGEGDGQKPRQFDFVQSVMNSYPERARALQEDMDTYLYYRVFDVLRVAGEDVSSLPLRERKTKLAELMPEERPPFYVDLVPYYPADEESHTQFLSWGFEGSVVKDLTKPYAQGKRGSGWFKLKYNPTVDVVITGFDPGVGKFRDTFGAVRFGQYNSEGVLVERGACSGMEDSVRKWMHENRDRLVGRVIEVSHNGLIDGGVGYRFRHPQFQRMRPDKDAEECTWHDQ